MNSTLWFTIEDGRVVSYYESETFALVAITNKEEKPVDNSVLVVGVIVAFLLGAAVGASMTRDLWVGWRDEAVCKERKRLEQHYAGVVNEQQAQIKNAEHRATEACRLVDVWKKAHAEAVKQNHRDLERYEALQVEIEKYQDAEKVVSEGANELHQQNVELRKRILDGFAIAGVTRTLLGGGLLDRAQVEAARQIINGLSREGV